MEHSRLRLLLKHVNVNAKISEIKKFFKPVRIKDAKILKRGVAVVYFRSRKDLDISLHKQGEIHGTAIRVCPYEDELFINTPKTDKLKPVWDTVPVEQLRSEIKETGRLFVRNLQYDCTEAELLELFSSFGTVSEIHLSFDRKLQRSKGFAFVTYLFPDEALAAFNKLDKYKFKNRLLHILPGKPREVDEENGNRGDEVAADQYEREVDKAIMSEFQKKRHAELKSMASVSHNWNTLFVSPDAVATYLSARFGVSKERLLDATSKESAAVRIAHGEAQLVHEIRDFLKRQGVRLDLLTPTSASQGRRDKAESQAASTHRQVSGCVFLIKNLPVGTTEEDVADLLRRLTRKGAHSLDPPRRILVPPLGITAIVEYAMPQIARLAYKALAYEPYNDNILYVQWAPEGILSPPENRPEDGEEEHGKEKLQRKPDESTEEDARARFIDILDTDKVVEADDVDVDIVEGEDFRDSKQRKDGQVADANDVKIMQVDSGRASKRRKQKRVEAGDDAEIVNEDKNNSRKKRKMMQEGADEVNAEDDAEVDSSKSRKKRKQTDDDEEFSIVQKPAGVMSSPTLPTENAPPKPQKQAVKREERGRVILVRNVAFQASQSEVSALFKPIGGLVKVRMPQKPSGGHRGFAFVEFATEDQAKSALETFGVDTHFMGRRLNIEYARSE
ncbi:putative RNA-binding protein 19 [Echinococcus granulosus]|uniref:RNA-binding protein n=1 Tax=Echinococcus granulosus TaxID=6210 RepID=W6UFM8_ECHGR|nr:putative RNA-binding protein [Echinococcus granulosus]EUB60240.1 putative RNA-binding protein [Echinococcus granulosus]KAH9279081.1 putative RNA-binding protein 19 [Echinococcus granulosus]